MSDLIFLYILGAFVNSWFICTWFFTSLPLHLFKLIMSKEVRSKVYSWDDWNNWLMCHSPFIAELLGCPLCLGFWSALVAAIVITSINSLTIGFLLSGWFTWPLFAFCFYKTLEK
tara:strand:+ start:210 stop:554 length:345 start_codon:yes stop_codon:yes gene_type:complete